MEYDGSIRVNLNNIPSYEINADSIKRIREISDKMEKAISAVFSENTKRSMERLNSAVDECLTRVSSTLKQYNFDDTLKGLRIQLDEISDTIGLKNMEMLQNIDFSRLFQDSFYRGKYDEASKWAFEYVEDEIDSEDDITQEELLEIFNEQIEDKVGWYEKFSNKSEKFKKIYDAFCKFMEWFLNVLITAVVSYFLTLGIAYVHGKIVSEPKEDAPDIYYFDKRTEINIIGETDNYYFITYTDDDGNEITGYSEKENIEIVPESNDDESMEETE